MTVINVITTETVRTYDVLRQAFSYGAAIFVQQLLTLANRYFSPFATKKGVLLNNGYRRLSVSVSSKGLPGITIIQTCVLSITAYLCYKGPTRFNLLPRQTTQISLQFPNNCRSQCKGNTGPPTLNSDWSKYKLFHWPIQLSIKIATKTFFYTHT